MGLKGEMEVPHSCATVLVFEMQSQDIDWQKSFPNPGSSSFLASFEREKGDICSLSESCPLSCQRGVCFLATFDLQKLSYPL